MKTMRVGIAHKLIFTLGALMILSFTLLASIQLMKLYDVSLRQGELVAQNQSNAYTTKMSIETNDALIRLEGLQQSLQQMKEYNMTDRSEAVRLIENFVREQPYILGVFTVWEPNAFDNQDGNFRNKSSYDDDTGRFVPYIVRQGDKIVAYPNKNYENIGDGDYYQIPKRTKKFALMEPYYYDINGERILISSFVYPILDEQGKFLGVVGADISLDMVQQEVEKIRPMGGYATMITAGDSYLANGFDRALVSKPYLPLPKGESLEELKEQALTIMYTSDPMLGGTVMRLLNPIHIKDQTWYFETIIPKGNMLKDYYKGLSNTIIISLVAFVFTTMLMILLIRKIVLQNIRKVVHVSSALVEGDTDQKLDIDTKDEFEFMAQQFNRMIDHRKASEELIEFQATHDLLTGLPNRYGYTRHIEQIHTVPYSNKQAALLYIDLDRFKVINDTLDYAMGDQLLKQFADRLKQTVGSNGRVFRFGGDEFVVLLNDVNHMNPLLLVADDILLTIAEPIQLNDRLFYITASIGISLQHELTEETGDRMVKEADTALFVAKKQRNTSRLYSPSMKDVSKREQELENGLFPALEGEQFVLYYQPKVDLKSGQIYGAEALIRWRHPEFGMISPLDFIPLAEKTGFIIPLGEWVLRTACKQIKMWEQQGVTALTVSVNMSMLQFQQKHIVETIQSIITEASVRPEQIELELTETIFMDNPDHTLKILRELQQLGIRLSLDDFGTGYSSLSYLQNIPLHYLKLDKSFIHDIVSDFKKQMIFKSLVVIAHNLNMKVVTEGVETDEELQIIRQHKCDLVQGYIYSPPVTAECFIKLYQKHVS
ncbi:hypothetical protein ASF12_25940 [Paenibacillus sp. Leaf72]|nr:hypothetical protein ASF12_25940 [Paenibacillus sp. Leaf72]